MANLDKASDIVLQTRKDYKPLETNLDRAIGQEKVLGYQKAKDKAEKRASRVGLIGKINAGGLPPRLADEVNSETQDLFRRVEDGSLDPESIEYDRELSRVQNLYSTHKEGWGNLGTAAADMVKNPDNYVVMGTDEQGNFTNNANELIEQINGVFYEGQDPDGMDGRGYLSGGFDAISGAVKVDKNLPTTLRTHVQGQLPSMLNKAVEGINVSEDTPYTEIVDIIKDLTPEQRQALEEQMINAYGEPSTAYLLSINEGQPLTTQQRDDFIKSFIPQAVTEQKTQTSQEQLEKDRKAREARTLQNKKDFEAWKRKTYGKDEELPFGNITFGGEYNMGDQTREISVQTNAEPLKQEFPAGQVYNADGSLATGETFAVNSQGTFVTMKSPDGALRTYWSGTATTEQEIDDGEGGKKMGNVTIDVLIPADRITQGDAATQANILRKQAADWNRDNAPKDAKIVPYQPTQPLTTTPPAQTTITSESEGTSSSTTESDSESKPTKVTMTYGEWQKIAANKGKTFQDYQREMGLI